MEKEKIVEGKKGNESDSTQCCSYWNTIILKELCPGFVTFCKCRGGIYSIVIHWACLQITVGNRTAGAMCLGFGIYGANPKFAMHMNLCIVL